MGASSGVDTKTLLIHYYGRVAELNAQKAALQVELSKIESELVSATAEREAYKEQYRKENDGSLYSLNDAEYNFKKRSVIYKDENVTGNVRIPKPKKLATPQPSTNTEAPINQDDKLPAADGKKTNKNP